MFNRLLNFIRNFLGSRAESPSETQTSVFSEYVQELLEYAYNFDGTENQDWDPIITTLGELFPNTPLPDLEICLVPPGSFQMGRQDGRKDEKPAHIQQFTDAYWIARYPVTNAQWQKALASNVVNEPHGYKALNWYKASELAHAPVVGVNWFDARAFCYWLTAGQEPGMNITLPTERHWEYAAGGPDSWLYPWGDTWQSDKAIWSETSDSKPNPVFVKPDGASWVGAMHMSGNVWEWQLNEYRDYPYDANDGREHNLDEDDIRRVLRGGAFSFQANMMTCTTRNSSHQLLEHNYTGLRIMVTFS